MTGKPASALLFLAVAGAGLLLAACAEPARVQWHKAGTGADDWERDQASCRYRARRAADREFRAAAPEQDASLLGGRSALERDMAVYDAQRRQRQIFEDCLRNLGYAPDPASKK